MRNNLVWLSALFLPVTSSASPAIVWDGAVTGSVRERVDVSEDAGLIVLISGEQQGRLGDCGCPARPLGGVARIHGYAERVERETSAPVLLVNAGDAFDDTIGVSGTLTPEVQSGNALMGEALSRWDLVNIGVSDVPWLDAHPVHGALSANLLPTDGRAHQRVYEVDVSGHRVAIVGLAGHGLAFLPPEHHRWSDPVAALSDALSGVTADTVVVVGLDLGNQLLPIASHPRVDVLISAGDIHERWAPELLGNAVWVRSITDGQVLTEVQLTWDDALATVRVRSLDLDERMPETPFLRRLTRQDTAIREGITP